jgi:hypothetical protein
MLATTGTQRELELITAWRADTPTAQLITVLESRCRALELLQTTQSLKAGTTTRRHSHSARAKVSKPIYCNVATQLKCSLCNASDCFTVANFQNASQTTPGNHDADSIACNHTQRTTHVQYMCVVSQHTLFHMARQTQVGNDRSATNQSAGSEGNWTEIIIVRSRGNPETTYRSQQPLLKFRINLVSIIHAEHCWTVLLSHISSEMCTTFEVI